MMMMMMILRLNVILSTCGIIFCSILLVESTERAFLESIVFAKEGELKRPDEFANLLRQLDNIWKAPKSILVSLIELASEQFNCNVAQIDLRHANEILKDFSSYVNIVNYTKHQRELLVERCAKDWTRSFIDSYYDMDPKVRSGTLVLKEQIRMAKEDGLFLHNGGPLYTREALVEGIYRYLRSRPDEMGKKLEKKVKVKKDEFTSFYNNNVANLCSKLLFDESTKSFVEKSNFFLEQISVYEDLVKYFKHDFKDFMSRVYICRDIERNRDLSDEVYQLVRSKTGFKKCFLKRHFTFQRNHN